MEAKGGDEHLPGRKAVWMRIRRRSVVLPSALRPDASSLARDLRDEGKRSDAVKGREEVAAAGGMAFLGFEG
jgi:hypothetical protein